MRFLQVGHSALGKVYSEPPALNAFCISFDAPEENVKGVRN